MTKMVMEENMEGNIVGSIFVGHKKGIPKEEVKLIEDIVRNAQKLANKHDKG